MATLRIAEADYMGEDARGAPVGTIKVPFTGIDVVFFDDAAVQSAVFVKGTRLVRLFPDRDCYVAFGENPTADTTTGVPIKREVETFFAVNDGDRLSVLQSGAVFRKFGFNPTVGTVEEYIGAIGGTGPYRPTSATTLEIISADANDTAAGTGAREITLQGLDGNFDEISETVATNGLSASAATTSSFIRFHRGFVSSMGTYEGNNDGDITVRVSGGGTTVGLIVAGRGQTQLSGFCVPRGKTLRVNGVNIVVDSNKAMDIVFWQNPNANDVTVPFSGAKRLIQQYSGLQGPASFDYNPALEYSEYTDLWFTGDVSVGTGAASVEYTGELLLD